MCQYSYAFYCCGHDYFIWSDSIEYCGNRYLSAHSVDIYSIDMCKDHVAECSGIAAYYCSDCSEDHALEFELDE
jgi:hypothetical protein